MSRQEVFGQTALMAAAAGAAAVCQLLIKAGADVKPAALFGPKNYV